MLIMRWYYMTTDVHTFGLSLALGTMFLERRWWYAEKLHLTLQYQFPVSQYLMARGFYPSVHWCVWRMLLVIVFPMCLISLLFQLKARS